MYRLSRSKELRGKHTQSVFFPFRPCVNSVVNSSRVTVTFVLLLNSHFRTSHVFQAPYRARRAAHTPRPGHKTAHVASLFDYALRSSLPPSLFDIVFRRLAVSTHRNDVASKFHANWNAKHFISKSVRQFRHAPKSRVLKINKGVSRFAISLYGITVVKLQSTRAPTASDGCPTILTGLFCNRPCVNTALRQRADVPFPSYRRDISQREEESVDLPFGQRASVARSRIKIQSALGEMLPAR